MTRMAINVKLKLGSLASNESNPPRPRPNASWGRKWPDGAGARLNWTSRSIVHSQRLGRPTRTNMKVGNWSIEWSSGSWRVIALTAAVFSVKGSPARLAGCFPRVLPDARRRFIQIFSGSVSLRRERHWPDYEKNSFSRFERGGTI